MTDEELLRSLLQQWLDWWKESDVAPAKLPNALQIRTALVLADTENYRRWTDHKEK